MGIFSKTERFEFNVTGMDCGGCESKLTSAVSSLNGVKSVEASATNGTVVVLAKGQTAHAIGESILGAGFNVVM